VKSVTCKTHPRYKAKQKPRRECVHCWVKWLTLENERLKEELSNIRKELSGKQNYCDPIYGDFR
jgi:hypothetical protein